MANEEHLKILKQGQGTWGQWRRENPEIIPDLSHAQLSAVDLVDFDLRSVNLQNADLEHADIAISYLAEANLTGANLAGGLSYLEGVNLSEANLAYAQFVDSHLLNADLRSARCTSTNFQGANLQGANLEAAKFNYTILTDVDLTNVKGLELIEHFTYSALDHRTLMKSGTLPLNFLRGCGLPDPLINFAHSMVPTTFEFYSCFISYSHEDKSFARHLHDQLQARGIRCWLDEHQILPGHDIYDEVDRGIRLWDKVLLCCSKDSLSSWWVDKEISTAFDKEQALWKERGKKTLALIPLNLDGHLFSSEWQDGKAIPIKSRLAADFTGWETDNAKFEREFERLVRALRTNGSDREAPPVPKV